MSSSTAKIQKIGGGSGTTSSFIEEPAEKPVLESRGCLYGVADFCGTTAASLPLLNRLLWDTLQENYFGNLEGTPLQAIAKATHAVESRLLGLSLNPLPGTTGETSLKLNLAVAIVWGQYLYTALLGDTKIFLLRGLGVKEIILEEGLDTDFSSHLMEEGDIIVIVSKELAGDLNEQNFLSHLECLEKEIKASSSPENRLALIIKHNSFEEKELPKSRSLKNVFKKFKFSKLPFKSLEINSKEKLLGFLVVTLGTVLTASVIASVGSQGNKGQKQILGQKTVTITSLLAEARDWTGRDDGKAKDILKSAEIALSELSSEDKHAADAKKWLTEIAAIKTTVYKVQSLASFREASVKVSRPSFIKEGTVATAFYDPFWYLLVPSENEIYKGIDSTSLIKWLTAPTNLETGRDIAVDGDLYVLTDKTVRKFYAGVEKPFEVTGLDTPLSDSQSLFTSSDCDNLYIYDAGGQRVVVLDKVGLYQFQVTLPTLPFKLVDLVVDEKAKTFTFVGESTAVSGNWL